MYANEWMFGHGFFMPWLIVFPIILVLLFMMMRSGSTCHRHTTFEKDKEDEALTIARKRFAKGEIDEETFEKIKQKLS